MGGSSGSTSLPQPHNTTTTSTLPLFQERSINRGVQEANRLLGSRGFEAAPFSRVINQFSPNTESALQAISARGLGPQQLLNQSSGSLQNIVGGGAQTAGRVPFDLSAGGVLGQQRGPTQGPSAPMQSGIQPTSQIGFDPTLGGIFGQGSQQQNPQNQFSSQLNSLQNQLRTFKGNFSKEQDIKHQIQQLRLAGPQQQQAGPQQIGLPSPDINFDPTIGGTITGEEDFTFDPTLGGSLSQGNIDAARSAATSGTDAALRRLLPNVASQFAQAGRVGGGLLDVARTQAIADAFAGQEAGLLSQQQDLRSQGFGQFQNLRANQLQQQRGIQADAFGQSQQSLSNQRNQQRGLQSNAFLQSQGLEAQRQQSGQALAQQRAAQNQAVSAAAAQAGFDAQQQRESEEKQLGLQSFLGQQALFGNLLQSDIGNQLSAAGLSPGIQSAGFAPLQQALQAGQLRDNLSQQQLSDKASRFEQTQASPFQRLQAFMNTITGNFGGSQNVAQPLITPINLSGAATASVGANQQQGQTNLGLQLLQMAQRGG